MIQSRIRLRVAEDRAVREVERVLAEALGRAQHNLTAPLLDAVRARMGELCLERCLRRLVAQGRLLRPSPRVAHWVILPPQAQAAGRVPPEIWLDAYFAGTLGLRYYAGLLTAAACHGAAPADAARAHLMVERGRTVLTLGAYECQFHALPGMGTVPTQWHGAAAGGFRISTPEATALDLAKRQARRWLGDGIKPVIDALLERCSEEGMFAALSGAQSADAAERLAALAAARAPRLRTLILDRLPRPSGVGR